MKKPFQKISNHPVTGKARGIQLQSVTYLDYDLGEARLVFEEVLLDEKDEPIISNIVVPRKMTRFIFTNNFARYIAPNRAKDMTFILASELERKILSLNLNLPLQSIIYLEYFSIIL